MATVLAAEYRVADFDRWWSGVSDAWTRLQRRGAHRLVVYRSLDDGNQIFSTLGMPDQMPVDGFVSSPELIEYFDAAGVEDLPSMFAGRILEKNDLTDDTGQPGVIVAGVVRLRDPSGWLAGVHESAQPLRASGVNRLWTYRAFDDEHEMLILQEIDSEQRAREWVDGDDRVAEWMSGAGVDGYPPLFVGRLAGMLTRDISRDGPS